MASVILTNDWHFSVRNPVSRTDDYNVELLGLLDQIRQLAVATKAAAVCVAGDLFHDQRPSARMPYATLIGIVTWLTAMREAGVLVLAIPGNHDLIHDRYDSLPDRPLGMLFATGLLINVSHTLVEIPGVGTVYGVPWPDSLDAEKLAAIPTAASLALVHAYVTVDGAPLYGCPTYAYERLAGLAPHVKLWHFGHDHTDRGVTTLVNRARVVSIGALSRGSHDADTLTRTVKVAVATPTPDGSAFAVQQVAMQTAPADAIFNIAARVRQVQEAREIEAFVGQLRDRLAGLSSDYHTALTAMPLPDAVRARVDAYIAAAEAVTPVS